MSSTGTYTTQELFNHCHTIYTYNDGCLMSKRHGRPVGYLQQSHGYLVVNFPFGTPRKTHIFKNHRLIFLMHHGYLPEMVDHINGVRTDNRIENLRAVTPQQSAFNTSKHKRNTSGYKGVSFSKQKGKWAATICYGGKHTHCGFFNTPEEAGRAYEAAAERLFGEYSVTASRGNQTISTTDLSV